jgi:hypothetical protein
MLSFFSRKPFNSKIYPVYDTNLSKYVTDTTNKIKKDYSVVPYNTNYKPCICPAYDFLPIISMLSFLAGYYFSKYNM